jgi:integrase/recombinase XerD
MTRRVCGPLDGPLQPYGPGFETALASKGYSADSIGRHLRLMVHLSRWLAGQHMEPGDLTPVCAQQFLRFRKAQGRRHPASMAGMAPLLDYLGSVGAVPAARPQAPGPMDPLIAKYQRYLLQERGLSLESSVPHYVSVARSFVAHAAARTPGDLDTLSAAEVTGFILSVSRRRSTGDAKAASTRLRSFLRYLEIEGLTRTGLPAAVPAVAGWQLTGLPRAVSAEDVGLLLGSCDRSRPAGQRDFAILTVLARLGLRAGEVAALRLRDIDWRAGELTVRGKGGRHDLLPLAQDVGEAIAGWLQDGRPHCMAGTVFTRVLAPYRGMSDRTVSGVVRRACARAGLPPMGSHRLRHTAATRTQRRGVASDATFCRRREDGGARVPALPGFWRRGRLSGGHAGVSGVPALSLHQMAGCGIGICCIR